MLQDVSPYIQFNFSTESHSASVLGKYFLFGMGVRPWAVAALAFTGVAGVGWIVLSYASVRRRRRDSPGKRKEGDEEGERVNRTWQDGCGSTQTAVTLEDPQGEFGKEFGVEERKRVYGKSMSEKDSADAGGHTPGVYGRRRRPVSLLSYSYQGAAFSLQPVAGVK